MSWLLYSYCATIKFNSFFVDCLCVCRKNIIYYITFLNISRNVPWHYEIFLMYCVEIKIEKSYGFFLRNCVEQKLEIAFIALQKIKIVFNFYKNNQKKNSCNVIYCEEEKLIIKTRQ